MDVRAIHQILYLAISPPDIYLKLKSDSVSTDNPNKGSDKDTERERDKQSVYCGVFIKH